ncbi:hypothetical protein EOPP23_05975 [Endozoicomonas sp. OPT23]|nr:hypothetical protein [Endozoicomonas sp. OPT23]
MALLQGCSKPQDCPKVAPVQQESVKSGAEEESYDCSSLEGAGLLKKTWCDARSAFEGSSVSEDISSFTPYLTGFRNGVNDASQAETSKVAREALEGQREKPEEAGYRAGYKSVLQKMGIHEYNCRDSEQTSEFKDRWCEAEDAYRVSGVGSTENPFVRGRFIDGYMAGGRVALTVPTSMEAFLGGDNPQGKQSAIFKPEGDLRPTENAFYKGFDDGYKAMIASIRESINQVMQQMQAPNGGGMQMPDGMQLPEGLVPPQSGQ